MIGERSPTSGYPVAARAGTFRSRKTPKPSAGYPVADRRRPATSIHHSVLLQLMLAMSFIALAAMIYLAQASQASVLQFNIDDLQATRAQLNQQNASLHASVTALQSLQRIDTVATRQLHMTKPDFSNTIWIQPRVPSGSPQIVPLRHTDDVVSAQKQSQPLGWLRRFLRFVKYSL